MTGAHCPHCGAVIGPGALFCMKCGADISGQRPGVSTRMVPPGSTTTGAATTRISQAGMLARLRDATLGEYEILAELGHGGMATVFLAHDLQLDRKVAIKVLSPRVAQGEGMIERFRLEARTAASLSHPHIIPIHAVRETDNLVYFVMKFIVGRPLDAIIKQSGPLPVPTVRTILSKVAEALGYAHRHKVVHRDIKPANIMIDAEGMPIVTDFGIAKVADRHGLTLTGAALGTPTYMSPEQCNADVVTGASDQYSLGIVAFEMLVGRPVYEGESVVTIMFKHVHDPPPTPQAFGPHVPPDLAAAVIRMLQKAPDKRWPTMEDVLPALRGADASHDDSVRTQLIELAKAGTNVALLARMSTPRSPISVRAQRPSPEEPSPAPRRRARALPIAFALSVLLAGGALAVFQPWRTAPAPLPAAEAAAGPAAPTTESPSVTPADGGAGASTTDSSAPLQAPPETASPVAVTREPAAATPVTASVRILDPPASLPEGQNAVLRAQVLDRNGRPISRPVQWASSDASVLAVRAGGALSAVAPGTATVIAEADGRRAEARVTVTPVVASITVAPATRELRPGDAVTLSATPIGRDGRALQDQTVVWRSSNERVAVVSTVGRVTAVGVGATVITAVAGGQLATSQIAVVEPAAAAPPTAPVQEPAPAVREDPQLAITALVQSYAQALQAKDLSRVKALYPGMTPGAERSTRNALSSMDDLRVRLAPTRITVRGDSGEAVVTGEWTYRGGRLDVTNRYTVERRAAGWVIVHIE